MIKPFKIDIPDNELKEIYTKVKKLLATYVAEKNLDKRTYFYEGNEK